MSTTLDLMEYATDAAAQAAYVTNSAIISNADILDEDMAVITDWTDADVGSGVSSQATFDGKSCMKLLTGAASGTTVAARQRDLGSFIGVTRVFSFSLYCSAIGAIADADYFTFLARDGTHLIFLAFTTDGLFIVTDAGSVEIGTDIVQTGVWQEWTLVINFTTFLMDVYLDQMLIASGVDCHNTGAGTDGMVLFCQYGHTTANRLSYVDWFKAGTAVGGLQDFSEGTVKVQGTYALKGFARTTTALNKTLTRTVTPTINLSGLDCIWLYIYASRTGANIKIGFHDSGGTTTEITPTVNVANTWQMVALDLSAVADANKDAIDSIIVTVVNADADNTFYLDCIFADDYQQYLIDRPRSRVRRRPISAGE
jgi:hypothetical protein